MTVLDVPALSQKESDVTALYDRKGCGLTSLMMVMQYYEVKPKVLELAEVADDLKAFSHESGWVHDGLINIARNYNLKGFRINYTQLEDEDVTKAEEIFSESGSSDEEIDKFKESVAFAKENSPVQDLERLIDASTPVIVSMDKAYAKTLFSHLIVLRGFENNQVIVNDPWNNGPDHKISKEDFEKYWTKRAIFIFKES